MHDMSTPLVLDLDDPRAVDVALVGASAANLAAARAVGLPALGGVVVTRGWNAAGARAATEAWDALAAERHGALVRPTTGGAFAVRGRDELTACLARAIAEPRAESVAFLIHPIVDVAWSGRVLGADPATGRRDRVLLTARQGRPFIDHGPSPAWVASVSRLGRIERIVDDTGPRPPWWIVLRVLHLAHRTTRAFVGPRDVPWLLDRSRRLYMLETSSV